MIIKIPILAVILDNKNNETIAKKIATHIDLWLNIAVIVSSVLAILFPLIGLLTAILAVAALLVTRRMAKEKDLLLEKLDSLTTRIATQSTSISNAVESIKSSWGQRYEGYENPRNLDIKAFVDRLGYAGSKGPVVVTTPQNRVQPIDDFEYRLYNALKKAGWLLNSEMRECYDVSAYGVTLKAIVENRSAVPPHFHTLKYSLEKSGCPVIVDIDIQDHNCEEVFLIVGADPP